MTKETLRINSNRQLFVDDYMIESMDQVELELHTPTGAGTALVLDQAWEGVTCDYQTVFKDNDTYRMYYRGSSHEGYTIESLLDDGEQIVPLHHETICYAESKDGINWTKPDLGLIEFNGSKKNSIVWLDDDLDTTDLVPFIDGNPESKPEERYKGIVRKGSNVFAVSSPDAVTWSFMRDEPILTEGPFDSQNVPFWDPWKEEYVIFTRGKIGGDPWTRNSLGNSFRGGYRWIRRATSPDFLNWSKLELLNMGDSPYEHLYTNGTIPYTRGHQIYLAFPRRFSPERKPREDSPWNGTSDTVFMSSRDGLNWDRRFMESIVRPGIGPRNWTSRNNLLSNGIVETGDDELSMYVLRHRDYPSVHFERLTLRKDGFVSVNAGFRDGEFLTRPFVFEGTQLQINYSTSAAGSIKVAIVDKNDREIEGFGFDDCPEIFGDEINGIAAWETGTDVSNLVGNPVKLRFRMKDSDIYSFKFD